MIFRFDEFALDARTLRLSRAGLPIEVQPRVLELLVYLVTHRDRLVGKQELVDTVWRGEPVSDAALARGIYEARRALGDDSRSPRYIQTIHGRGYRFSEQAAVQESQDATDWAPRTVPEAARPAPPPARPAPSRASFRAVSVVAAMLLVAAALALALHRSGDSHPVTDDVVRVAILPLAHDDETVAGEAMAAAFADLLARTLDQSPTLIVRGPRVSAGVSLLEPSLASIAARLEVHVVVSGSLSQRDGSRVDLAIHDFRFKPEAVSALSTSGVPPLEGDPRLTGLTATVRAAVSELAALLGSPPPRPPPGMLPLSAEGYTFFLLAQRWLAQEGCDLSAVVDALEHSLALDPRFAPAWAALAEAHLRLSGPCLFPGGHDRRAADAARQALHAAPGWPEARLLLSRIAFHAGKPFDAYKALGPAAGDPRLLAEQSRLLFAAGQSHEGRARLQAAHERDPMAVAALGAFPETMLTPPDLRWEGPAHSVAETFLAAHMAILDGDAVAAAESLAFLNRSTPHGIWGRLAEALLSISEGDLDEAAAIVRQVAAHRDAAGIRDPGTFVLLAQLQLLAGDAYSGLEQLFRAVDMGWSPVDWLHEHPSLEAAREDPDFDELLRRAEERSRSISRRIKIKLPPVPPEPSVSAAPETAIKNL